MEWYVRVMRKYFVFEGRAQRKEYWMFLLFNMIISLVLTMLEGSLGMEATFTGVYSLAVLIPSIAVSVRRLHDIEKSGWWMLINLVPLVGPFVFLFFMIKAGTNGGNLYGSDPRFEVEV